MSIAPFGASAPLVLRNGELLGHSPILNVGEDIDYQGYTFPRVWEFTFFT